MKRLILAVLASSFLTGAQAQYVIPNALGGAWLGAMIGGIAGGNCHNGFSGNGYTYAPAYAYPQAYVAPAPPPNYLNPGQNGVAAPAGPAPQAYQPAVSAAPAHQIADAPRVPAASTF